MVFAYLRSVILTGLLLCAPLLALAKEAPRLEAHKPLLLGSKNYTEYWDQYFIFEDGTLLTTQFLVGTFPFMKHKGILLSTLVKPDGTRYVIKNGRKRKDWSFDEDKLDLRIYQHRLAREGDKYILNLHNSVGEVRLDFTSPPGFDLPALSPKKGRHMLVNVYAPQITASGQWRPGPADNAPWQPLVGGQGFGMHVLLDSAIDNFMEGWIRVFGMGREKIILSTIIRPDGKYDTVLKLYQGDQLIHDFKNVDLEISEMAKDKKMGDYPRRLTLHAKDAGATLEGSISFTKKLDHFRLSDHLSTIERMLSKIFPSLIRYRYLADYNIVYKDAAGEKQITGKALGEYADIVPALTPKKKKRRKK